MRNALVVSYGLLLGSALVAGSSLGGEAAPAAVRCGPQGAAKDAWRAVKLGPENIVRGNHTNALIPDPKRGLIYAMIGSSAIHALRFDPKTAEFFDLKQEVE